MDLTMFIAGVIICCLVLFGSAAIMWLASRGGSANLTGALFALCAAALLAAAGAFYLTGG